MASVDVGKVKAEFVANTSGYTRGLRQVKNSTKETGREAGNMFSRIKASTVAATAAVAGLVAGIVKFSKSVLQAAADVELFEVGLTTILKSQEKAKALHADLLKFARTTPFEIPGLRTATRRLLAFGFSASEVLPVLRTLGDAVGALGGDALTLRLVTRAIGQIQTKGRVQAEELLQLAESGIPAFEILREKLKLTAEQVGNIGNQGINAAVAVKALLEGMDERFGGGMQRQAQTLSGVMSNVNDTFTQIRQNIGAYFLPAAKDAANAFLKLSEAALQSTEDLGEMGERANDLRKIRMDREIRGWQFAFDKTKDAVNATAQGLDTAATSMARTSKEANALKKILEGLAWAWNTSRQQQARQHEEARRRQDADLSYYRSRQGTNIFGGNVGGSTFQPTAPTGASPVAGMGFGGDFSGISDFEGVSMRTQRRLSYQAELAQEEADAAAEAYKQAQQEAERLADIVARNAQQTKITMRELGVDALDTQARITQIGENLGANINQLVQKTAQGIQEAKDQADRAMTAATEQAAQSISRLAENAAMQIAALRSAFARTGMIASEDRGIRRSRQTADINRRRMYERADFEERFRRQRDKLREKAEKELQTAFTSEEQQAIRDRLNEALSAIDREKAYEEDQLAERRRREDEWRQIQIQREDEDYQRQRARAEQQLEERISDIQDELEKRTESINQELELKLQTIQQERDARIVALNEDLAMRRQKLEEEAGKDIQREIDTAKRRYESIRRHYFDRIPEAARAAAQAAFSELDSKLSSFQSKLSSLQKQVSDASGALIPRGAQFGLRVPGPVGVSAGLLPVHGGDVIKAATAGGETGPVIGPINIHLSGSATKKDGRNVMDGILSLARGKGIPVASTR